MLIEKDWLSAGHKFQTRCGHANRNFADEQRSPIFLQFIDCVWQCLNQFPCEFEFNEKYLISLMDHVYSCKFGTFLCNNERERILLQLEESTSSFWIEVYQNREVYANPFYLTREFGVIYPSSMMEDLSIWKSYYLRWCRSEKLFAGVSLEARGWQLQAQIEALQKQIQQLQIVAKDHQNNNSNQQVEVENTVENSQPPLDN